MKTHYKKMYLNLFNKVTDALKLLPEDAEKAAELLREAQRRCEEMYMDAEED